MGNSNMEILPAKYGLTDIKRHLVDLHRLRYSVNVQQIEAVVEESVRIFVVLRTKIISEKKILFL